MFLIFPFALLFWALPAVLMLTGTWKWYGIVLAILLVIVALSTGVIHLPADGGQGGCVQGSCDGGMVTSALQMMLAPAWLTLIACAILKGIALRSARY